MSGDNKTTSTKKKASGTNDKLASLMRNITSHSQALAEKSSAEAAVPAESNGVVFIDNSVNQPEQDEARLVWLDPDQCYAEKQVRDEIHQEDVIDRRKSIEAHGQIKPIEVQPRDERGYKIDTGEIRWRACSIEPKIKVMAIIRRPGKEVVEHKRILKQLAENTEAVPVSIYEIATNLKRAQEAGKIATQEDLAKEMGWHDDSRPDYGRNKVSQYMAIFNLDERGQRLYAEEKLSDLRSIKILSAIRTVSETSYNALITMAENGETITRKMLESERDRLVKKPEKPVKTATKEKAVQPEDQTKASKSDASTSSGGIEDGDKNFALPRIIFKYNRREVELVYEDAKPGKVYCRLLDGNEEDGVLELDCDEVIFDRFILPK